MSTLKVDTIQDSSGTGDLLSYDSATNTVSGVVAGRKNVIINGNFDIWQRGTSQTSSGYGSADRWNFGVGTSTLTATQQAFVLGQTDVPSNPKYYLRSVVTTGSTAGSVVNVKTRIEGVDTFAGETVTLSFWAKADAAKNIAVEFEQFFGTGGSPSTALNSIGVTTVSLTTGFVKQTVTVTLPSISGKTLGTNGDDNLQISFWFDAGSTYNARTNSLGNQSGTFDIAQVQLEKGSVATSFERRSIGEELALCQRYFEKSFSYDVTPAHGSDATSFLAGSVPSSGISTNNVPMTTVPFKVEKRAQPTVTLYGNSSGHTLATSESHSEIWSATSVLVVVRGTTQMRWTQAVVPVTYYAVFANWIADAEL